MPDDGGTRIVFDTDAARAINEARINWLERANLPLAGRRVLDVGCGIGHFIPFYLSRGCTVVAVDGRAENIDELRRRHPGIEAHVADAQELDAPELGVFDVIHCFGLLYHLDSPVAALRRLSAICDRLLILETMVCDSMEPLAVLVDETKAASQAMDGLGSRPSPAFIALAPEPCRVRLRVRCGRAAAASRFPVRVEEHPRDDTRRRAAPLRDGGEQSAS
jgi:SAM-dependent methyltransferase